LNTAYIFIDFENVQPKDLALLKARECKVLIFVGATQTKLPTELVCTVQSLGRCAEYVRIEGSGRNALDFHIAYHLGRVASACPDADFAVISKDTGFDPLMQHLKQAGITCRRLSCLSDLPALRAGVTPTVTTAAVSKPLPRPAVPRSAQSKPAVPKPVLMKLAALKPAAPNRVLKPDLPPVEKVLANLVKRGNAKPRTVKALSSSIQNVLGTKAPGESVVHVMAELERRGAIKLTGATVAYLQL
jgi:hypothetical protein